MAKKKTGQLPSGNVRIQVYDYTDTEGRKHYKSFTAPSKAAAKAMAAEWKNNRVEVEPLTVYQACEKYVALKQNVLAPGTINAYRTHLPHIKCSTLGRMELKCITGADMQAFISDLSMIYSPKLVKNVGGLLTASISVFLPNLAYSLTYPRKPAKSRYQVPCTADIQKLLDACNCTEMRLAILFAAVGTMRRSEVCALEFKDIDYDNMSISVRQSYVYVDGAWTLCVPKTEDSERTVLLPKYIFDLIRTLPRKNGFIVDMYPSQLNGRFSRTVKRADLPSFRFHDLRHYAASNMHAQGVPERYIEAIGGWRPGSNVLKRVYENVIPEDLKNIQSELARKNVFVV